MEVKMSKYYRVAVSASLPKDERKQAANWNVFSGRKFKSQKDACAARDTLPEKHLFDVIECIGAMNPF
jgi:hypothetical protein